MLLHLDSIDLKSLKFWIDLCYMIPAILTALVLHELGHALLVKLLTPDDSIERITISAEGSGALGYVRHTLDGIGNRTKRELENRICIKMAGLASEEVFLGEYGNGGTSDLESATRIATKMITRYGMSKNGFVYWMMPVNMR